MGETFEYLFLYNKFEHSSQIFKKSNVDSFVIADRIYNNPRFLYAYRKAEKLLQERIVERSRLKLEGDSIYRFTIRKHGKRYADSIFVQTKGKYSGIYYVERRK